MLKAIVALALAGVASVQDATAQSLVRKTDAQDARPFEYFLPPVSPAVPWLNLDTKTRLPKGDYPVGRNAEMMPFSIRDPNVGHADLSASALQGG
jgi:hypothetical protein